VTLSDKEELEIALMTAQIENLQAERENLRAETERFRQEMKWEAERFRHEMRWEPWKALAAILGGLLVGIAAMTGAVLALASWLSQHPHGL
jgi:hypothetical protein